MTFVIPRNLRHRKVSQEFSLLKQFSFSEIYFSLVCLAETFIQSKLQNTAERITEQLSVAECKSQDLNSSFHYQRTLSTNLPIDFKKKKKKSLGCIILIGICVTIRSYRVVKNHIGHKLYSGRRHQCLQFVQAYEECISSDK